jgi:hypothetical protein
MAKGTRNTIDDFWSRIPRSDPNDCWEWQGTRSKGYGFFSLEGKMWTATRLLYTLTFPDWDGSGIICHHCDNPPCMNPAHLFLGTDATNALDKHAKGRANMPRGEKNWAAKLTPAQVREIRESPLGSRRLARLYPMVHRTTILHIRAGSKWRHLV